MIHFTRWKVGLIIAVVIFGIVTALPTLLPSSAQRHWPSWLPYNEPRLGIEYTGGTRVVLAANRQAFQHEYLMNLRNRVHSLLIENRHRRARVVVEDDHLLVRLTSTGERDTAYELLDDNYNAWPYTWVKLQRNGASRIQITVPSHVLDSALSRAVDHAAGDGRVRFQQ